ncbi:MAG TPA: metalloregulator ArsR/SmtB family transcription factor [Chloroflexota bacterium]|nr:metalloregulator ArsR/SmtB family transcription factor [Chloroflexota bacterium]
MELGEEAQTELLKAVSHPVRLRILAELVREEECVCHLSSLLKKPQPYVSQQLAALKAAGLVLDRRDAQRIYYRTASPRIGDLLRAIAALAGLPESHGGARHHVPGCPCPKCSPDTLERY